MKRLNKILVVTACAVALVGCRADNDTPWGDNNGPQNNIENLTPEGEEQQGVPFALAVQTQSSSGDEQEDFDATAGTRTVMDELQRYYWLVGDKIGFSAVGATDKQLKFANNKMVNNQTGQRVATLFDGVLSEAVYASMTNAQRYRYTAYYPYDQNAQCVSDAEGNVTIQNLTLPSEQSVSTLGTEGFPVECDFMVTLPAEGGTVATAAVNDFNLEFEHLFAAVKLYVNQDNIGDQKVKTITLTAPEGTPLTGKFEVNTSTMEVTFTEPSNSVTVNIPAGLGTGSDNCVWAIINPVDLSDKTLTMTVTTVGGLVYDYTFPAKSYTRGVLHPVAFDIPKFTITSNFTTSYSVYKASGASAANALNGQSIYINKPIIGSSSDNAEQGKIYTPVGYNLSCKVDGVETTATELTGQSLAAHTAQAALTLSDGTQVTDGVKTMHVTGLPYRGNPPTNETNRWSWNRDNYEFNDSYLQLNTGVNTYDVEGTLSFYVPQDTPVKVTANQVALTCTSSISWPQITMRCGGTTFVDGVKYSATWGGTNIYNFSSNQVHLSTSNSTFYAKAHGNLTAGVYIRIPSLIIEYR